MIKQALLVRLEAKPGKENEVAEFLKSGLELAMDEPDTVTWYGVRLGTSTFAIFDTFTSDEGRQAHLTGKVAAALMEHAPALLLKDPVIEFADVIAVKTAAK